MGGLYGSLYNMTEIISVSWISVSWNNGVIAHVNHIVRVGLSNAVFDCNVNGKYVRRTLRHLSVGSTVMSNVKRSISPFNCNTVHPIILDWYCGGHFDTFIIQRSSWYRSSADMVIWERYNLISAIIPEVSVNSISCITFIYNVSDDKNKYRPRQIWYAYLYYKST